MKVKLPGKKVMNHSREFVAYVTGDDPESVRESVYYLDTDEIEFDFVNELGVLQAYEEFKHDPMWDSPAHHKRVVELLDKDDLTEQEEHELRKLERRVLKEQLRGRK
jgi:hypothetical protein